MKRKVPNATPKLAGLNNLIDEVANYTPNSLLMNRRTHRKLACLCKEITQDKPSKCVGAFGDTPIIVCSLKEIEGGKMLSKKQIECLKQAKLAWDKAFIDSPCSKRCLCIPFDDELNKLYEQYIHLREILEGLVGK